MSIRAIRKHLVLLEGLGLLSRWAQKRENGSNTTDLFKLKIGALPTSTPRHHVPVPPPAPRAGPPRHLVPPPPAPRAGPEPSLTTTVSKEPETTHAGADALPHGIEPETWEGFLEIRHKIGKPPTERAVVMIFRSLGKMKAEGEDVNAVLEQSVVNEWAGVFPVKDGGRKQKQGPQRPVGREKFDPVAFVNRGATRRQERDVTDY
ncbi:hypothetical protein SAMN05216332_11636 [Nitrosospira briensis]|nr:hypothetical protein SAMN05216332_11636 [Nitrosospira briensis]